MSPFNKYQYNAVIYYIDRTFKLDIMLNKQKDFIVSIFKNKPYKNSSFNIGVISRAKSKRIIHWEEQEMNEFIYKIRPVINNVILD